MGVWELIPVHEPLSDHGHTAYNSCTAACSPQVAEFRAVEALAGGALIQEMPVHISNCFWRRARVHACHVAVLYQLAGTISVSV